MQTKRSYRPTGQALLTGLARTAAAMAMCANVASAQAQLSETELAERIAQRQQITDVPTVYISIPAVTDLDRELNKDAGYFRATMQAVCQLKSDADTLWNFTEEGLKIKVRGNSSAMPSKRSYRLKFDKDEKDEEGMVTQSHKHDLTGRGYKKRNWTLLANAADHTLMRNAIASKIGEKLGLPFNPGYKFVDLVVNDDYRGTYQLSDHIEADANRVSVKSKKGWIVELLSDGESCEPPYCVADAGYPYLNIKNPDYEDDPREDELTDSLRNEMRQWFARWRSAMDYNGALSGWRAYNEEGNLMSWYMAIELTGNTEGTKSIKAYRNPTERLQYGPLWDNELAFGNLNDHEADLLVDYDTSPFCQYLAKLWDDPKFAQTMSDDFFFYSLFGLADDVNAEIDRLAALLKETQRQNFQRWGITTQVRGEKYHEWDAYDLYVEQLRDYLSHRIDFLEVQFDKKAAAAKSNKASLTIDRTQETDAIAQADNLLCTVNIKPSTWVAGEWRPICLPFDANEQQLRTAFGSEFQMLEMAAADQRTIVMEAPSQVFMAANVPYLLRLAEGAPARETISFQNVYPHEADTDAQRQSSIGDYTFQGICQPTTLVAGSTDQYYVKEGNRLSRVASPVPLYGLNAYWQAPRGSLDGVNVLLTEQGISTAVTPADLGLPAPAGPLYNLQGQRVDEQFTPTARGIYVRGGRKVIARQ